MGVERAVTRWYVQRQVILDEIALLEASLQTEHELGESGETNVVRADAASEYTASMSKLAMAQERLRLLGPCPKPMMG
ncbi:hypothetical protein KSF_015010 [Reticulibacter mediterranei]|uniref:Uncharacterized protein n=1 Tax=Reticulibacter mediterranei TaxID=2778369 RepID=A0A8J3IFE6_9CHLR|nr:hypothetical protein [Reticulibacter mediterranei]GHO91453.1 hypothetical protein KSF_015010 [Reticulibacter mediterranei]